MRRVNRFHAWHDAAARARVRPGGPGSPGRGTPEASSEGGGVDGGGRGRRTGEGSCRVPPSRREPPLCPPSCAKPLLVCEETCRTAVTKIRSAVRLMRGVARPVVRRSAQAVAVDHSTGRCNWQ
jgi:hypothetical protein